MVKIPCQNLKPILSGFKRVFYAWVYKSKGRGKKVQQKANKRQNKQGI